jgi:DNA-binding NtrC family response regulator
MGDFAVVARPARGSLQTAGMDREPDTRLGEGGEQPAEDDVLPLKDACELFERDYVMRAVQQAEWNITGAARVLGVHRNTILKKLAAWGLHRPGGNENQVAS